MFKLLIIILLSQIKNEEINIESNHKIKAAIFDFDTLIDTQKLNDEINQIIINKYGDGRDYSPEYKMFTHGSSLTFENRFIFEQYKINITLEELKQIKDDYIKNNFNKFNIISEGAKELTNILKHKLGIKTIIITSLNKDFIDFAISYNKEWFETNFDMVITGEDKRIKHGKPSPDIFILAAESLRVKLEECIIFEHSLNGIKAAMSSGISYIVGLPDSLSTKYVFENFQYNIYKINFFILNSLKDLDYSIFD